MPNVATVMNKLDEQGYARGAYEILLRSRIARVTVFSDALAREILKKVEAAENLFDQLVRLMGEGDLENWVWFLENFKSWDESILMFLASNALSQAEKDVVKKLYGAEGFEYFKSISPFRECDDFCIYRVPPVRQARKRLDSEYILSKIAASVGVTAPGKRAVIMFFLGTQEYRAVAIG